ncbi:MAG: hypothetical protein IT293_18870 [Deltaproteobacteria bacterium]|nr:hypothetical protein [Deltaproteobacteria bacterium]
MKTTARCLAVLLLASGLALGGCGGDDAAEPEGTGETGGEHEGEGSGDPEATPPEGEGTDGTSTDGTGGDTSTDTPPEGEGGGESGGGAE